MKNQKTKSESNLVKLGSGSYYACEALLRRPLPESHEIVTEIESFAKREQLDKLVLVADLEAYDDDVKQRLIQVRNEYVFLSLLPPLLFFELAFETLFLCVPNRLGLKRVIQGAREIVRAIYEVDCVSLFEQDPDDDDDDESQSQSQAREPVTFKSYHPRTLDQKQKEKLSPQRVPFFSSSLLAGPTRTFARSNSFQQEEDEEEPEDPTPPFPTGGVGATHPESEYGGVMMGAARASGSSLRIRTQATQRAARDDDDDDNDDAGQGDEDPAASAAAAGTAAVITQQPRRVCFSTNRTRTRLEKKEKLIVFSVLPPPPLSSRFYLMKTVDSKSENEESRRHVWKSARPRRRHERRRTRRRWWSNDFDPSRRRRRRRRGTISSSSRFIIRIRFGCDGTRHCFVFLPR